MADTKIKRMNFFDGLFLTQEEFGTEQNYHKEMRHHHNAYFHGFGIIDGLEVARHDNRKLKITPGAALIRESEDNTDITQIKGVEIVLSLDSDLWTIENENLIINLDDYEDVPLEAGEIFVCIGTEETLDNQEPSKGGETPIHIWEKPVIYCENNDPYEGNDLAALSEQKDIKKIVLAKVVLDSQGDIMDSAAGIVDSGRIYAGFDAKQVTTEELLVKNNATINENLSVGGNLHVVDNLSVNRSAVIDEDLTVQGNLHVIGDFEKELMIKDDIITLNKSDTDPPEDFKSGIEVDRGSYGLEAVLLWHEGDESTPDNEKRWKVGFDGASGDLYDLAYGKDFKVDIATGRVGIGTREPEEKLDVRGGRIRLKEDTTEHEISFRTDGDAVDVGWRGADLWISPIDENRDIFLDPLNLGNVGIGSSTPSAKLSLNGGLHVGGDSDPGDNNLLVDGTADIDGNLTVGGNLTVQGNATLNTQNVVIEDDMLLLNKKSDDTQTSNIKSGIEIYRQSNINPQLVWNETAGRWRVCFGAIEYDIIYGSGFYVDSSSGNVAIGGVTSTLTQKLEVNGNVSATNFIGNGSTLTNLNGSQITSGTIPENRIPSTIARDSEVQAYFDGTTGHTHDGSNGPKIPNITSNHFNSLDGSALTNLNGSQITSGTIPEARIPSTIARDSEVQAYFDNTTAHTHDGADSSKIPGFTSNHFSSLNGSQITNLDPDNIDGIIPKEKIDPDVAMDPAVVEKLDNLEAEVIDARGIKENLGNRLDESITAGGQLRFNVVGIDQLDDSVSGKLIDINRAYKVPLLRQIMLSRIITTPVGRDPIGVAFDGKHMWVACNYDNRLDKIDITTNAVVETVSIGSRPYGVAFDGAHIWICNFSSDTVSKVDIATNEVVETLTVGDGPIHLAFDGSHMWVSNYASNNVSKINVASSSIENFSVGTNPRGVVFDGTHIWVINTADKSVSKLNIATNATVATIPVEASPYYIAFDGTHIWIPHFTLNSVTKINAADNSIEVITGIKSPMGIAFDGTHMWVTNYGSNSVNKIDIETNKVVSTLPVGTNSFDIAFDGMHMWVTNYGSNNVSKILKSI